MSTTVKAKGDFKQVPAGTHPAYCYAVIDIGRQESHYGVKSQLILSFEFPHELVEYEGEQRPMVMSAFYTASISKKARLREDLEAWRGKPFTTAELDGFELKNVIGKPCTISVTHNEEGKARVNGVSAIMKGINMPAMFHRPLWFDVDEHGEGSPQFAEVPEWIQQIIKKRVVDFHKGPAGMGATPGDPAFDDDIPF